MPGECPSIGPSNARLKSVGVSEVFGPGARTADIIAYIEDRVRAAAQA